MTMESGFKFLSQTLASPLNSQLFIHMNIQQISQRISQYLSITCLIQNLISLSATSYPQPPNKQSKIENPCSSSRLPHQVIGRFYQLLRPKTSGPPSTPLSLRSHIQFTGQSYGLDLQDTDPSNSHTCIAALDSSVRSRPGLPDHTASPRQPHPPFSGPESQGRSSAASASIHLPVQPVVLTSPLQEGLHHD